MTALGIETDDEVTVTYPADVPVELPPWYAAGARCG